MTATAKTAAQPKRRIGRYLVTGRIGRGGMGMVYRVLDEVLEREVAVKTLTVEGTLDEESRKRFEIEAKAAAKLQHPNILTVFELGEDRGMPFIAMELLPGVDLEVLLRSGEAFLLQEKIEIAIQVLRGLAFAHEHGIVHRDIKPSNLRILDDGTVKILDFGIAKLSGTNVTKSGMMVGTVHYMSPEQIRGRSLDGRSDVFSVGVILHELLAGRRPFSGEGPTEVLYKIVHDPPPTLPIPELGEAGPRLQEITSRALEKEPEARYPGAAAMMEDLAEVLARYLRSLETTVSSQDLETMSQARRLLKEGRLEDGQKRLREIVARTPHSVEARRVLRTASRELLRQKGASEPAADDFSELDATFQASPTQRGRETLLQPAVSEAPAPAPAEGGPGRGLTQMLLGVAVLALLAAVYLLRGHGTPAGPGSRPPAPAGPPGAAGPGSGKDTGPRTDGKVELVPSQTTLPVITEPAGAVVTLDGRRLAGTTPLDLTLDPTAAHRLAVSLDGHRTQELLLSPGKLPAQVQIALEPTGPLGSVAISSAYPLEVSWRGRVLAQGKASPRVSLPAGRQTLSLAAPGVFLRSTLTVDVKPGGESAISAPGLGKVNIRANPDNCQVYIDGAFVDYPPINEKPVAAGTHSVSFRWADGPRHDESFDVARGGVAFVTGRRD